MPRETINPASMFDSLQYSFSHATRSRGGTFIHCAGQAAIDADGNLVGEGDLALQARQALANLKTVLVDAGAGPADVVRLRTYVVDHSPEKLEIIGQAIDEFFDEELPAANTLLGVQALAFPELLIEIEATAVID